MVERQDAKSAKLKRQEGKQSSGSVAFLGASFLALLAPWRSILSAFCPEL
jgi:hypothetical protein